jgi:hypothetical protein
MGLKVGAAIGSIILFNSCAMFNGIDGVNKEYRFEDPAKAIIYGSAESGLFGKSNIRLRSNADKAKEAILRTDDGTHFILSVEAGFYTLQVDNTKCVAGFSAINYGTPQFVDHRMPLGS